MDKKFINKTLSSLVEQQMNVSNTVMNRTTFKPSSNYNNNVHNKKPYNERGPTYLGQFVLNIPKNKNVAFHNWEEYKRLGLKWGEPIVIVRIKDNHVFYLEYTNGSYEEKGMVLLEQEEIRKARTMQTFLMNKEKNFGHQEGFPIPMKRKLSIFNLS
jgi:hypothetical protein